MLPLEYVATEEAVIPIPYARDRIPAFTAMRSGWITTSIRALRERGHFERYLAALPAEHHAFAQAPPTFEWVPVERVLAHYAAADSLGLGTQELLEIGGATLARAQGSPLDVGLRLARGAGVTPWTMLEQGNKVYARNTRGGAVGLWRLGPKEARVEFLNVPFARFAYNRLTMRGLMTSIVAPLARTTFVREIPQLTTDLSIGYRLSWV